MRADYGELALMLKFVCYKPPIALRSVIVWKNTAALLPKFSHQQPARELVGGRRVKLCGIGNSRKRTVVASAYHDNHLPAGVLGLAALIECARQGAPVRMAFAG